jgi:regulator of protease activity HflC (stomatin/prohibitin superfamily)
MSISLFFSVQEKQAVIIQRFGKFKRVVGPGWHWIWPFIDRKRKFREGDDMVDYVDQRERAVDLPAQSVITKDNVQLSVDSMVYYQISDPQKAVYNIKDVITAVNHLIKTVLRDVIGDTSLQELLSGREEINRRLREQVENASGDWGITIRSVELQSVNPPDSYVEAMRRVSEAELAKKAAITEAEGKKQASILEAEGEAEKINKIYGAIHAGNPNDELLKIKYLEALEKIADGQATKVFMPFPANPTSDNFFQQAFGMAAGLDAYRASSESGAQETGRVSATQRPQSQTTPINQPGATPPKKIIRRVIKKPVPPSDSEQ